MCTILMLFLLFSGESQAPAETSQATDTRTESKEGLSEDFSNLDAAMLEIAASIEGMDETEKKPDTPASGDGEESDDDSDSDDEEGM